MVTILGMNIENQKAKEAEVMTVAGTKEVLSELISDYKNRVRDVYQKKRRLKNPVGPRGPLKETTLNQYRSVVKHWPKEREEYKARIREWSAKLKTVKSSTILKFKNGREFTVHYGGFTAVHGFFVLAIFHKENGVGPRMGGENWPCFLVFVQMLFNMAKYMYSVIPLQVRLSVLALFASHGISFVYNYFFRREYAFTNPGKLMASPYGRIVVMHIAILAGGFLVMTIGSPAALLAVLVVLKTGLDVSLHNRSHRKAAKT